MTTITIKEDSIKTLRDVSVGAYIVRYEKEGCHQKMMAIKYYSVGYWIFLNMEGKVSYAESDDSIIDKFTIIKNVTTVG